jgi:hypothetical protein
VVEAFADKDVSYVETHSVGYVRLWMKNGVLPVRSRSDEVDQGAQGIDRRFGLRIF